MREPGGRFPAGQDLPPLQAPRDVTAVAGQVPQLNGEPLTGVRLEVEGRKATSDATGRFLVTHVDAGPQVFVIDGKSANGRGATYGLFEVGVNVVPRETTPLSFSVWMPTTRTATCSRSPTPAANTTSYAYNSMDRVESRTDPLTRAETYLYDNNGNLRRVTDRNSQITNLTYDALNRVLTRTFADTSTLTFTWDAGNRLICSPFRCTGRELKVSCSH